MSSDEDHLFGTYVRGLRKVRGLTQEQLAEQTGLAPDTIRRLESSSFSPSLRTLRKLTRGLGISMTTLFHSFEMPTGRADIGALICLLEGENSTTVALVTRLTREILLGLETYDSQIRQ